MSMHKLVLCLLATIFLAQISFAQLLYDHRLFTLSIEYTPDQSGYLGCIDYTNNGQVYAVDSFLYRDFNILGDKLLATGQDARVYQVSPNGLPGLLLLHTFPGVEARMGFLTPSWIIYLRDSSPHFLMHSYFGLVDTLGPAQVPPGFVDAMLHNNRLYILYPDELRIVPLNPLPVGPVTVLPTPTPFPFGGMNTWMLALKDDNNVDHIYIDIEYATALERTSLIELDTATLSFDTIFHYDILSNYYRPLAADGMLYLHNFDTRYDPVADTVIFTSAPHYPFLHTVGYSQQWQYFLLHRPDLNRIYIHDPWYGNLDSTSLGYPVRKFHYWYDVIGASREETLPPASLLVYQDQAGWRGELSATDNRILDIGLFDLSGRRISTRTSRIDSRSFRIQSPEARGIFLLVVLTEQGPLTRKLSAY